MPLQAFLIVIGAFVFLVWRFACLRLDLLRLFWHLWPSALAQQAQPAIIFAGAVPPRGRFACSGFAPVLKFFCPVFGGFSNLSVKPTR